MSQETEEKEKKKVSIEGLLNEILAKLEQTREECIEAIQTECEKIRKLLTDTEW